MNPALLTSKSVEWVTPLAFFKRLDALFRFDLDACATPENAKAPRYYTAEQDGLAQPWTGTVWCNPPYGRAIAAWVEKAYQSARGGATVVLLVPARTDTRWWQRWCQQGEVYFVPGRLKFGDAARPAPFPCAVVVLRPRAEWAFEADPA